MTLSERIKLERTKKGWSQATLGEKLNVTQQAVGKWEKGIAEPDTSTIKVMAKLFDVSTDYLIGNNPQTHPTIENDEIRLIAKDMQELNPEALKTIKDLISQLRGKGGDIKPNE